MQVLIIKSELSLLLVPPNNVTCNQALLSYVDRSLLFQLVFQSRRRGAELIAIWDFFQGLQRSRLIFCAFLREVRQFLLTFRAAIHSDAWTSQNQHQNRPNWQCQINPRHGFLFPARVQWNWNLAGGNGTNRFISSVIIIKKCSNDRWIFCRNEYTNYCLQQVQQQVDCTMSMQVQNWELWMSQKLESSTRNISR